MQHILAALAATPKPLPPGTFTVAGHVVPAILGQVFHWIAKLFVILGMIIILALLKFRDHTPVWQLVIALILGAVALPHTSQHIAKGVSTITSGSSVASTGASIGLVLLIGGLILVTLLVPPILRKRGGDGELPEG
jgi:hypothetical protein